MRDGEEGTLEKIHACFKVISLCQVGPNGEGLLITTPAGDEWVSQAVRRAGLGRYFDRQRVCVHVCAGELTAEQNTLKVLSWPGSRCAEGGCMLGYKALRSGVNNHCDLTLTTWRGDRHIRPAEAISRGTESSPKSHASNFT